MEKETNCPLCSNIAKHFFQDTQAYYRCGECDAIFVHEDDRPDLEAEKERYELHENDVEDKGYQKFVSPITNAIMQDFTHSHKGLDFGAGTGPVLSKVLKDHNYNIKQYDPFFHNYPELLQEKYDYIASCEVIEHFYNPYEEFELLKSLLKPGGKMYFMTEIYNDGINFADWYYWKDPTHVFFYSSSTFTWIKNRFVLNNVSIDKRLIIFSK